MIKRFGTDLGDVIIGGEKEGNIHFKYSCLKKLKKIIYKLGLEKVFIISKRCIKKDEKSIKILKDNNFWKINGFKKENIYYVREIIEKSIIARKLQLDVFIDDKLSVLKPMDCKIKYWFPVDKNK